MLTNLPSRVRSSVVYEPKYKLNARDEKRWRELVTREAVGIDGGHPNIKPLTAPDREELERLQRKRYRKMRSHPRMIPVKAAERRQNRKLRRLLVKLQKLTQEA